MAAGNSSWAGGGKADYPVEKGYVLGHDSDARFVYEYPLVVWNAVLRAPSMSRAECIRHYVEEAGDLGVLVRYVSLE